MTEEEAFGLIREELGKALKKHGPLANSGVGLAAIVEEVGELAEALLQGRKGGIVLEVSQVGALAVRFLMDCA